MKVSIEEFEDSISPLDESACGMATGRSRRVSSSLDGAGWKNRRRAYARKPLPRLRRRERLNWHQWLSDWYTALNRLGFICCNPEIKPTRTRVTAKGLLHIRALYMQHGDIAVYLYSSADAVPLVGQIERMATKDANPPKTILRIVQGRRPDRARKVCRLEDNSAINIIPRIDQTGKSHFLVDFGESLYELDADGVWQETTNGSASELFEDYLRASPHYRSIRPYGPKSNRPTRILKQTNFRKRTFA